MSFYIYSIIPMALMLSLTHCLGMCGGFVLAYNAKLSKKNPKIAFFYSFSYQISRVFAYICLGALGGYFGSFFKISVRAEAFLHFFLGLFLAFLGVALLMRGKILAFIENDKIYQKFLAKPLKYAFSKDSYTSFLLLGFLNGLLPCGVVYTFLAMAIMSSSLIKGAIIMAIFGIFTMPLLLSFSFVLNLLNLKYKSAIFTLSAVFIIVFGIYNSYLGFILSR